jgi:hypothetical protein
MPSLIAHYAQCRRILCQTAKRRETISYKSLAGALGLRMPVRDWRTVLGPISTDEVNKTGHDLTLVVVYSSGPSEGLPRYFSDVSSGAPPQSQSLDPLDEKRVKDYKVALEAMYSRYATEIC